MRSNPDHTDKLEFIQALRGIAALLVVLRHCWEYIGNNAANPIGRALFMPGGAMGVDLFFVISGFIMTYTTWGKQGTTSEVKEFFVKRITRIFPTYATIMLVEIFARHGGFSFFGSAHNLGALFKALTFQPQGDISAPPYYGASPLSISWTLNYELYFYLIFGISMLFGRLRWIALFSIATLTLVAIPYFTRGQFSTNVYGVYNYSPFYLNLVTNPIIWLFIAGVVIGMIYRSRFTLSNLLLVHTMALGSIAFVLWQYFSQYQMNHGLFLWGLSLVPLVLCLALANKARPTAVPRFLSLLGSVSFSLYLVHISVMSVLDAALTSIHAPIGGIASYFLVLSFSIAAAMISHHYLEQRLSNAVRKWLTSALRANSERIVSA